MRPRRRDATVAMTEIVRKPSEAETALRQLHHQLRLLRLPPELAGGCERAGRLPATGQGLGGGLSEGGAAAGNWPGVPVLGCTWSC